MAGSKTGTFTSFSDFNSKFYSIFKGPTFYSTFTRLDKKLRKKIMIAVSVINNCSK